jgi:hypothetical protein
MRPCFKKINKKPRLAMKRKQSNAFKILRKIIFNIEFSIQSNFKSRHKSEKGFSER